jgi:hypothetical protein
MPSRAAGVSVKRDVDTDRDQELGAAGSKISCLLLPERPLLSGIATIQIERGYAVGTPLLFVRAGLRLLLFGAHRIGEAVSGKHDQDGYKANCHSQQPM